MPPAPPIPSKGPPSPSLSLSPSSPPLSPSSSTSNPVTRRFRQNQQDYLRHLSTTDGLQKQLFEDIEQLQAQEAWETDVKDAIWDWAEDKDTIWRIFRVSLVMGEAMGADGVEESIRCCSSTYCAACHTQPSGVAQAA